MVIIVVSMVITEYLNVTGTATFMKNILTQSIRSSCDYFAQETYKSEGNTGGVNQNGNVKSINSRNGEEAVSGRFFIGADKQDIYNSLYKSSEFKSWYRGSLGGSNVAGTWRNLDMLASGLGINTVSLMGSEKEMGKSYVKDMMTPLNLGIPYLDRETVEKICKWNIAYNFSEGRSQNIVTRPDDKRVNMTSGALVNSPKYVQYRGFRVYYDSFKITSINYKVYDIRIEADRKALQKVINVDANNLYDGLINSLDERAKIGVASVNYNIDIDYAGVTPMGKIINQVFNGTTGANVNGFGKHADELKNESKGTTVGNHGSLTFSNGVQSVPVSDKIYYYIIR